MKIFLDTANLDQIRTSARLGVVDGVTTNPSLLAREAGDWQKTLAEICAAVDGPVSAEVIAEDFDGMIREAHHLTTIAPNVVVKVPMTREGVRAIHALAEERIKTNATLVFSPAQALLVAKAGATFVSPFVGRMDDISQEGLDVVRQIVEIYEVHDFETEVLAASIRHPMHVVEAALAGAHVATMPVAVFDALFRHPLTDRGIQLFLDDWRKAQERLKADRR
ncbi:MAG: fructose-6-phosphate aldolase [Candidatus Eisenbacteria bacterium]|nr:fructose-6-phosphate aldolase [Candidatus Eisenbacteria bacterium]